MRRISIILLSLFLKHYGLVAQNNALGLWLMYSGNFNLRHYINVVQELHYRSNGVYSKDVHTLLYRNGIGVNLSKDNNNVLLGYTYIKQFNYNAEEVSLPLTSIEPSSSMYTENTGVYLIHNKELE